MKKNSEVYASQVCRGRKFKTSTQERRAFVGTTLLTRLPIKSNLGFLGFEWHAVDPPVVLSASVQIGFVLGSLGTFKRTRAAPTLLITPSVLPSPQSVSIPDLGHYPGKMEKARQCAVRAKRAQSLDYCERCNQALCTYPYFKRYHTLQNYKIPCDVPKPPTS